jgi:hypothetical protein
MITEKTDLMPEVSPSWTASHWTEGRGESVRRDVIRNKLAQSAHHAPSGWRAAFAYYLTFRSSQSPSNNSRII